MGSTTTRSYRDGEERVPTSGLDEVADLLAGECELLVVDIDDPTPADLAHLAGALGLHPLAIEDALDPHQRDKYVHYEHHVFLVAHCVSLDVGRAELATSELDVFIGSRWMVIVHRGASDVVEQVVRRWDKARQMTGTNVGVAVYALLDVVVEGYFETVDRFETFYDDAADQVFGESPIVPTAHRHWFEMRRSLNQFHRVVRPLAEALRTVVEEDIERFGGDAAPYLHDAAGELARVSAEVESVRELVDHLVDANLMLRDYHQNVVMKKVTSWAAIIAVPTLVTGWYGMNVPYPGEGETWGVITSTAVAVVCSGALYVLFRRKRWL